MPACAHIRCRTSSAFRFWCPVPRIVAATIGIHGALQATTDGVMAGTIYNGYCESCPRQSMHADGIVNLFSFVDEFSPQRELFLAISSNIGGNLLENEDLFPTLRGK